MEFASALDLYHLIGFVDHLQFLKNLHSLYGLNYIHTVEGMQESGWMEGLYCKDQEFRRVYGLSLFRTGQGFMKVKMMAV